MLNIIFSKHYSNSTLGAYSKKALAGKNKII